MEINKLNNKELLNKYCLVSMRLGDDFSLSPFDDDDREYMQQLEDEILRRMGDATTEI